MEEQTKENVSMRERVLVKWGSKPIILVAPHGADDINTDEIALGAANKLDCYAVVNRGFERSKYVDTENDKADCNKINHVKQDVVYEEYLKPIEKFVYHITRRSPVFIFHIHGAGDIVHKQAGVKVGVIVGYGLGAKKNSLTCSQDELTSFLKCWDYADQQMGGVALFANGKSKYAGRSSNNMNQYYARQESPRHSPLVSSMQLEFPYSSRKSPIVANSVTGKTLADTIHSFLKENM